MSRNSRFMTCTPEDVFTVLTNGWTYTTWVVGAAQIRNVDDHFPAPGSQIYHSVGVWPALVDDTTEVEHLDVPHEIVLRVRAWPTGEGQVRITAEPEGTGTRVVMHEDAVSGLATLLPRLARDPMLVARNMETLRRLAHLAENKVGAARFS